MSHFDVAPLAGYHTEVGLLLSSLQDSTREWRLHLGDVPIEAIVWQPAPDAYSIGALILHIVDCEDAWFHAFLADNVRDPAEVALFLSDETIQDQGQWPIPPAQPLSWYFELHDRIRARAFEAIKSIDPNRIYDRYSSANTCTARWVIAHVLEHDSYTGGQAVAMHELFLKSRSPR